MGPRQEITTCLRRYATVSGRASLAEFWLLTLPVLALLLAVPAVSEALFAADTKTAQRVFDIASALAALALFVPLLAMIVRRFHEVRLSGWRIVALSSGSIAAQLLPERREAFRVVESDEPLATSTQIQIGPIFVALLAVLMVLLLVERVICLWPFQRGATAHGPNQNAPNPSEVPQ
ncbi:MAG: DUF805 domain-containing protein [Rhodobacteraceae bacterium]|nr:DUF805 domain-containing protein [Paracoccaceae bacterium]